MSVRLGLRTHLDDRLGLVDRNGGIRIQSKAGYERDSGRNKQNGNSEFTIRHEVLDEIGMGLLRELIEPQKIKQVSREKTASQ